MNLVLVWCFFWVDIGSVECWLRLCLGVVSKPISVFVMCCSGLFSAGLGLHFMAYLGFADGFFGLHDLRFSLVLFMITLVFLYVCVCVIQC